MSVSVTDDDVETAVDALVDEYGCEEAAERLKRSFLSGERQERALAGLAYLRRAYDVEA